MANSDPVFCPQCKIGFAPDTALCPICKVALVCRDDLSETPTPVVLQDDLSSLQELRTATVDWIRHLEEKLAQAGIPYRTELSEHGYPYLSLYVRPEDVPRAKDIDHEVFTLEVPGTDGLPRVEDLDFWSCPACGNRLGQSDRECSGCGLVLVPTEYWGCGSCNRVVEVSLEVCPNCGAERTRSGSDV